MVSQGSRQGYAPAQGALGQRYADGRGVTQSTARAVHWKAKAAQQGDKDAAGYIELNLSKLTALHTSGSVALRARPEATAPLLLTLKPGEILYRLDRVSDWYEVYVHEGHTVGFVGFSAVRE